MKRFVLVGAGPVGLYLACVLAATRREVTLLERTPRPGSGSRAIGLHPPALEALGRVLPVEQLLEGGTAIRCARVYLGRKPLGELSLDVCPPPYRFVLSLPQSATERRLRERLAILAPGSLVEGCDVTAVRAEADRMVVELAGAASLDADFVVGCDGRDSSVRTSLGIAVRGREHGHYMMADVPDTSGLGDEAAIFLTGEGVVESFPLPGRSRRWVAKVPERYSPPSFERLAEVVRRRTGFEMIAPAGAAPSAFTAETRVAEALAGERWALVGDAGHVVSPIGGQGMNLGILGAAALAAAFEEGSDWRPGRFERRQRQRVRRAAARAALNMALGREHLPPLLQGAALSAILAPAVQPLTARWFTMRWL